jgi:hypothetical protein
MRSVLKSLSKLTLTICLLGLPLAMTSCRGCSTQPQPEVQQSNPSPATSPPDEPQSVALEDLESGADYQLSGTGDSQTMKLQVTNRTNRTWLMHVEEGTKLEPSEAGVQSMVATREIHVTVHPHEEPQLDLEVACLDISKAPPASSNNSWSVNASLSLRKFIACVNGVVDDLKTQDSDHASQYEQARRYVLQASLWKARGASKQDWINFYTEYQRMSEDEARQEIEALEPALNEITNKCPSLQ